LLGGVQRAVLANVTTVLVSILELSQCLDDVDVLARPCHDQFRAFVQTVVQHLERLEDVTPVLSLIVQSLVKHIHDLVEVGRARAITNAVRLRGDMSLLVEGDLGDFSHV
jgi:hypothetical protein